MRSTPSIVVDMTPTWLRALLLPRSGHPVRTSHLGDGKEGRRGVCETRQVAQRWRARNGRPRHEVRRSTQSRRSWTVACLQSSDRSGLGSIIISLFTPQLLDLCDRLGGPGSRDRPLLPVHVLLLDEDGARSTSNGVISARRATPRFDCGEEHPAQRFAHHRERTRERRTSTRSQTPAGAWPEIAAGYCCTNCRCPS